MPALQNASSLMANPAPTCTGSPIVERDDTDAYQDALCLYNEILNNADGLWNPNGLINTFRTQIYEVVDQLPAADFVPVFQDATVVLAFALFLNYAPTLMPTLFPVLLVGGWLVAAWLGFMVTNVPFASSKSSFPSPFFINLYCNCSCRTCRRSRLRQKHVLTHI